MAKDKGRSKEDKQSDELKCITPVGIACMVHVWEPFAFKAANGQKEKEPAYRLTLVFDEKTWSKDKEIKRIVQNAIVKKWGADEGKRLLKKGKLTLPWRDADDYSEYGEPFDDDTAKMISVSSRQAPGVVDERARPILKQQEFFSGCLARCSVYAHAYDSMGNMGVTLLLNNVQKAGETGKKYGGTRADPTEEFDSLSGDDDDGDDDMKDLLG